MNPVIANAMDRAGEVPPTTAPRHKFWGAGEPDCPTELKAPNGELHTLRCKVCGDGWRKSNNVCLANTAPATDSPEVLIANLIAALQANTEVQTRMFRLLKRQDDLRRDTAP